MATAVNMDYENDVVLRVSPRRSGFIVEEYKQDGSVAYKEISPVDLFAVLNDSYSCKAVLESGFLPKNCISVSMNSVEKYLVLWNDELRADMEYKGKEYMNFPIPRLVFRVRILDTGRMADCAIGVVADEEPTEASVMYHYPFSNVLENSMVCTGNNVLPKYPKLTALQHFPRYLLGILDNDDLYNIKHNKLQLGHLDLMELLKDKEPAYYYSDILVPNGKTLGDFISWG